MDCYNLRAAYILRVHVLSSNLINGGGYGINEYDTLVFIQLLFIHDLIFYV